MDTSNFQDLGNSPNPSNDLHAGEFAKPSLVSPVSPLGAASYSPFLYAFAIRIYLMSGRSWIYNCVAISENDAYELAESSTVSTVARFSVVWQEKYQHVEFKENFSYSQLAQEEIKKISDFSRPTFGSLVRITEDYRPDLVGQIGIISGRLSSRLSNYFDIAFSVGSEYYEITEFELIRTTFELIRTSSNPSKDLQPHLVGHLNALLAVPNVDAANIPLLLFVAAKLHDVILLDADGVKRVDIEISLFNACQFLRFGYEDLTNGSKFGRRVSGVFVDAAFEKLKNAAVILNADAVAVSS